MLLEGGEDGGAHLSRLDLRWERGCDVTPRFPRRISLASLLERRGKNVTEPS